MGLSIKVYNNLKIADENQDNSFEIYVIDESWKNKVKNFEYGKSYTGDLINDSLSYPYSSHGRFREALIRLIQREDLLDAEGRIKWNELPSDLPFIDLICFADNEGCLDFEVAKNLFEDFEQWKLDAEKYLSEYELEIYKKWKQICKDASNNGVIVFW